MSTKKQHNPPFTLAGPAGQFSAAVSIVPANGRMVFVSGMTARKPDGTIAGVGDIEMQTRQVCEKLKAAMEDAGGKLTDICRVDIYVRNIEHFDIIQKVRQEYFSATTPAETMVEVAKMVQADYLIEISAIAVIEG